MPAGILDKDWVCVNIKIVDNTKSIKTEIDSNNLLEGIVSILKYILSKNRRKNKLNNEFKMSDPFDELKKFYDEERRVGLRAMMGASLSFNIRPKPAPDPVELFMKSYLAPHMERFRDASRNTLKGFVVSPPKSRTDTLMLGISYKDNKDGFTDEDLWEASHSGLRRMNKTEAEQRYPEYKGYHRAAKLYFGHPAIRWVVLTRDFLIRSVIELLAKVKELTKF